MPPKKDLTGQQFGYLTVLSETDNRYFGSVVWKCICRCGKVIEVSSNVLMEGRKSCGCANSLDFSNKWVGKLKVICDIKYSNNNFTVWLCKCNCGKYVEVESIKLKSNPNAACSCIFGIDDFVGSKFGRLGVVRKCKSRLYGNLTYLCLCDCGKYKKVTKKSLKGGSIRSCGCIQIDDLSGQRFGRLYVVADTGKRDGRSVVWLCVCECNTVVEYNSRLLKTGEAVSCTCLRTEKFVKNVTKHGKSQTKEYKRITSNKRNEKEKKLDSEWTIDMEEEIRDFFSCCVLCGSNDSLAVDHVLPLDKGFGKKPGNAVVLCKKCNSSKGTKYPHELDRDKFFRIAFYTMKFKEHWIKGE